MGMGEYSGMFGGGQSDDVNDPSTKAYKIKVFYRPQRVRMMVQHVSGVEAGREHIFVVACNLLSKSFAVSGESITFATSNLLCGMREAAGNTPSLFCVRTFKE